MRKIRCTEMELSHVNEVILPGSSCAGISCESSAPKSAHGRQVRTSGQFCAGHNFAGRESMDTDWSLFPSAAAARSEGEKQAVRG